MHPIFIARTHREDPFLSIGQVAEITGASPKAIRHYEALGLGSRDALDYETVTLA